MANIGTAPSAENITATGTTQATAFAVLAEMNYFSTVAASTGAILDSAKGRGEVQAVYNGGANVLRVYPPTDGQINNLGTNAAMLLSPTTAVKFTRISATLWTGILSR